MNLLDILPVQNIKWNTLNSDVSLERLKELFKVYIMTNINGANFIFNGIIKHFDDKKIMLDQEDSKIVEIKLNDIIGLEDASINSISPFFGLSICDMVIKNKSYVDIIKCIKNKIDKHDMFVCITNKNNKHVYAILNDIDENYVYYTMKYILKDKIFIDTFKLDLKVVYNIEEVHLASVFDSGNIKPIDYIKSNTNYLSKFKEEDIKDIIADINNNLYILLNNGDLYLSNSDVVIRNIKEIYLLNYEDIFAIDNYNKIISFNNNVYQEYFGNVEYDKIITYVFGIAALKNNILKIVLNFEPTSAIDYQNFINVEDIKVDEEENELYVKKNNIWSKLFIN